MTETHAHRSPLPDASASGGAFLPARSTPGPSLAAVLVAVALLAVALLSIGLPGSLVPGAHAQTSPLETGAGAGTGDQGTEAGAAETPPPPPEVPEARRSPRATMMTFLAAFYQEDGLGDAVATLDLSEVPEDLRAPKGRELVQQLKDIIDRTELVDPEAIPDDPVGPPWTFLERSEGSVVIARREAGPDRGQWKFTAETVETIPDLFRAVEERDVVEGVERTAEATTLGMRLRAAMPRPLLRPVVGLELWQWIGLGLLALFGTLLDRTVVFVVQSLVRRRFAKRLENVPPERLYKSLRPLGLVAAALLWTVGLGLLALPVQALQVLRIAVRFVLATGIVWAVYRLIDIVSALLEERAAGTDNKFDDLLIPLVRTSLKILVVAFGALFVADAMFDDITSLLAGIGLGGLAVALAAQDTVRNLFGSFTVLADRPFAVDDWVVVDGLEGTVVEVGFRSTRIRTFYVSIVSIPNSRFIDAAVDNYGQRRFRRWKTTVGLAYDTPPETVEAFCEGVRELVRRRDDMRRENNYVVVTGFGASAIEILLYVFFDTATWEEELLGRHALALDILRLADRLGAEIAFPTRTLWMHEAPEKTTPEGLGEALGDDPRGLGRRLAGELSGGDPA